MTCTDVKRLLERQVEAAAREPVALPEEAARHIASCPRCLEDLALVETLVTGEPSRLLREVFERHACGLVEKLLPEWVQAERDGGSPAQRHPAAWRHAQGCERCRTELADLREMLAMAKAGQFGPLPAAVEAVSGSLPAEAHLNLPAPRPIQVPETAVNALPAERIQALAGATENQPSKHLLANDLAAIPLPGGGRPSLLDHLRTLARTEEAPLARELAARGQTRER